MKTTLPGILFCLMALSFSIGTAEEKPNIIYIMTDDLGYGDLGCYGQKVIQTPHLDQLAAGGMRFTDHYSGHTVCRPSRLVLWTGQHVGHTGLIGNRDRSLTGLEITVAKRLKENGYVTGGVGKWALGNVDDPSEVDNPGHPNNNGFDFWFGYLNQGNAHNFYPPFLWKNKVQVELPGNVLSKKPEAKGRVSTEKVTYSHDEMTKEAFGFIRENAADPFLLHIHWTIPHANNEGGRVNGDGMEVPDYGIYADKDWPNPEKGFAAMITRMDGDVGRLVALLKELEIDQKTLILFTSDNGPHQEGGHKHEYFDSNGPFQGYKRSMHEGGIRVPMIANWPGTIEAGTESDLPSAFWDFLPTACEIGGAPIPEGTDGISYLPTLLGKTEEQKKHEYLYWASSEGATSVGVREGKWKLVQYRKKKGKNADKSEGGEDWRLYDLDKDPGEETDLSEEHPEVVERILGYLKRDGLLETAAIAGDREIRIALIGDSTVTDTAGWGKAFAGKFGKNVKVDNFARGGRSAKSWLAEGSMGKGANRETDPSSTYRHYLRTYINKARSTGAKPILVSSVTRRDFDEKGKIRLEYAKGFSRPLRPWAEASGEVAAEMEAPFVDLYNLSVVHHNQIGEEASKAYGPKEGDITHFNAAGAEAVADLIVRELNTVEPGLASYLKK